MQMRSTCNSIFHTVVPGSALPAGANRSAAGDADDNASSAGDEADSQTRWIARLVRQGIRMTHGQAHHPWNCKEGRAVPPDAEGGGAAGSGVRGPARVPASVRRVAGGLRPRATARVTGTGGSGQPVPGLRAAVPEASGRAGRQPGDGRAEGAQQREALVPRPSLQGRQAVRGSADRPA